MNRIKLKTWLLWSLILIALGLVSEYFLVHRSPVDSSQELVSHNFTLNLLQSSPSPSDIQTGAINRFKEESQKDNFLSSLKKCAPDLNDPTVDSPESLIQYLSHEIGLTIKDPILENYHLELRDGSIRRIQVLGSDNTNSSNKVEVRYFKLDAEGIPERIPFPPGESLQSLLTQSQVLRHELRTHWVLRNGTLLNLEWHDNSIYEFQMHHLGKILSCRYRSCTCP
jgi:hypothetical protein